ncbi:hypothetical protein Tco_0618660 [Tanacetum coccineum]
MMMASKSYEKHPDNKELKHDDQDEDPTAGSDQGKEKKRPRRDTQPSNKCSASKESSKGKTLSKTSKSGKSVTAEEPHEEQDPLTFDELMATPTDFSKFTKNCLKLDKITKEVLVGPVYNLLKGTCQRNIKLEYNMEECYKALSDQLDRINPEGDRCPFDLSKPLPLKGRPGHLTVPTKYFFNNDIEYLKSENVERKYTTSITKTKAARYELVEIEDMIPKQWSTVKEGYNKDASFGISHWGPKHQLYYSVKVDKQFGYGYLEEIVVRRENRQLYTFKEGDFINLHLNDIEDMLLLVVHHKLFHLADDVIVDLAVALRMFTRRIVIQKRVKDVQFGVESYQKKLNITNPQKDLPTISAKELYTPSFDPPRVFYEDLSNRKRLMRADELYKKWLAKDQKWSVIMVKLIEGQLLERRIMRNLEILVGAKELEMDYRLMQRTI